jgi:ethanolamine utilization protein EutN
LDLARVVGRVVCTIKNGSLRGRKLLLVQPIDAGGAATGKPLVAIDAVGAGAAETVFFVTGREASFAFLPDHVPADAAIVGIVDHVDLLAGEVPVGGKKRRGGDAKPRAGDVPKPTATTVAASAGDDRSQRAVAGG